MRIRLVELQNDHDSVQACAAAGRAVPDANLRGWAALLPLEPQSLLEGLKHGGVAVLRGARAALALGSLAQLWSGARSLGETLNGAAVRALAHELKHRVSAVECSSQPGISNEVANWKLPRTALPSGRTLLMGVVNVTPDSFSDGGKFLDANAAIDHALFLAEQGADILDIGGESTNPFGAQAIDAGEERRRIEPVVKELVRRTRVPVSIDTTKAAVAQAALELGAEIVNDVSGFARDPEMAGVVARAGAAACLMHMRGTPQDMQGRATYEDLHGEVLQELDQALRRARDAGIPEGHIAIDPGLGFAKTAAHNLTLLRRLRELTQLGLPLVVGASRKSFIGKATGGRPAQERLFGSIAAAAIAAQNGAAVLRVHDLAATREALLVADAVRTSTA